MSNILYTAPMLQTPVVSLSLLLVVEVREKTFECFSNYYDPNSQAKAKLQGFFGSQSVRISAILGLCLIIQSVVWVCFNK